MNVQGPTVVIGLSALRILIPLLLTLAIGEYVARKFAARQQNKCEFEAVEIPSGFSALPHCWEVKNCSPAVRETCPAYQRPDIPCWLALQLTGRELPEECFACEVFHSTQLVASGDAVT